MANVCRWRWCGVAALVGWMAAAAAAPPPAEVFFSHVDMRAVQLSPSGEHLAVLMGAASRRDALFVVPVDDASKARAVAGFRDFDVGGFRWIDKDRLLYDLVDRQVGSADQRYLTGLNVVRVDGTLEREFRSRRLLAIPEDGSNEIIIGESFYSESGDLTAIKPLRLHLGTLNTRWAAPSIPGSTVRWWFDRQGEPRLALTTQGRGKRAWFMREAGQDDWTRVLEGDPLDFRWEPADIDGQGNLYVAENSETGFSVLKRWDKAARAPAAEAFVSTPGFDYAGVLVSDDRSGALLGVHLETDAGFTHWFDPGLRALQAQVDQKLPGRVNRLSCRRCTAADRIVLVHSSSPREPGHWFVVTGTTELRWQEVGRARRSVDPRAMASVEFHRIRARDGRDLPLWLTVPPGRAPGTKGPAVVLVHGGPWVRGGHWAWDEMEQFLASRGYLVINAEFRGSAGYGVDHFRAGWRQWGRAMQDDVADALNWAVQQGRVDPARVCIAGGSYGGYATLMGLVRHPDLYRCGAAWVAVTDPRLMFEALWRSDASDDMRRYSLPALVGDPSKDAEMLREVSPVAQAGRIKAPLLLAFGELDSRVPIDHAKAMRSALRDAGREPEYVVYNGEGHGWLKGATRLDFAQRLERFLARHLGPP